MAQNPGNSETYSKIGIFSLSKLFFKAILAFYFALGALRMLRGIFVIVCALLLAIPLKYRGDSASEPREKAKLIYGMISPRGGYPPCFAAGGCAPTTTQWIKETEKCLRVEPGCQPDTRQIIDRVKTCLADGSCKLDVYQLFQKEEEDNRKAELIEKYVKDGPPACFASGACSPDIADLVKKAEQTRKSSY